MWKYVSYLTLAAAACAFLAAGEPRAGAEEGAVSVDTVTAVRATVAAARRAAKGDAETVKALKAARATLEPYSAAARAALEPAGAVARAAQDINGNHLKFAVAWNELVTVSAYHGVAGKRDYMLGRSEILWRRYLLGMPAGTAWSWKYNGDTKNNDQLHMFVDQIRPNGEKLRQIKVWTYRWDTTYSGIGGENSKGLAKIMHELDRDSTAKSGRKVSPAVTAKRMNAEFDRTYYYYVEGFDVDEEKNLRRDNYYFKGADRSFNFEIISYKDPGKDDDAVTKWQLTDDDPEIRAVLDSIAANPAWKPQK